MTRTLLALTLILPLTACGHPVRSLGNAGTVYNGYASPQPWYVAPPPQPVYVPPPMPRQTYCNRIAGTVSCTTY